MLGDLFTGPHLIILLVIVVLLFGATRLPALAKAIGQSARIFKSEVKESTTDDAKAGSTASTEATTALAASSGSEAHSKP